MSLDDYANSMFRFERIHPRWIESCAHYLRHIFGETLQEKVFLDYAFGRGNWSLAALKAGARGVVAVDASEGNVRRFSDYCRAEGVAGVEIIHGNVLEQPIPARADVLWIYGILPCISDPIALLTRIAAMRSDDLAVALIYAYDQGSLRQMVVDAARRGLIYASETAFAEDSLVFTPRARLRARDDLTAPLVTWYGVAELAELAKRAGLIPVRQPPDFRDWLTGNLSEEFSPPHLLCGFGGSALSTFVEPARPYAVDRDALASLARLVMDHAGVPQRRRAAVGLFNTHFSSLSPDGRASQTIVDDFLFLMHAALRMNLPATELQGDAARLHSAAVAAMTDSPRSLTPGLLASSVLARFLEQNTVRL